MLFRLDSRVNDVVAKGLSDAEVYRDGATWRRPTRCTVPGMLNCPICEHSAAAFLPFGLGRRRNALCPTCGSLERHRFLWLYLSRFTRLLRQLAQVLHAAPEPCLEARLRSLANLRYRSLDRYDPAVDVQADLADLPFEDDSFDLVISSHVLEHLPADRPALAELSRVLRRGGRAVVMVPYDPALPTSEEGGQIDSPAERLKRFGHPYHYRNYGADLPDRLAEAGLAATAVRTTRLLTPHRRRYFRLNDNFLFDCTRL